MLVNAHILWLSSKFISTADANHNANSLKSYNSYSTLLFEIT